MILETKIINSDVKIMVLRRQILILENNFRIEILKKSKFQNLAELLSQFSFKIFEFRNKFFIF